MIRRRRPRLPSLIAAATLGFAFACAGEPAVPDAGHDGGSGRDGGDGAIDPDHDSGTTNPTCVIPPQSTVSRPRRTVGLCPELDVAPCSHTPFDGEPLLTAEELEPGAKLVAGSGSFVLAEAPRPDGSWKPIVVELFGPEWTVHDFPPIAPEMRARDIDGRSVLLCSSVECQLFTIPRGGTIEELAGARIAADPEPRGVLDWRAQDMACVFGDGVSCFDGGSWREIIPADGPRFNAAAATRVSIWAVGDYGRIVAATPECWIRLPSGTHVPLRSVSADPSDELWATVAGDEGVVAYVSLDHTVACHVGDASWAKVHRTWGYGWSHHVAHIYDTQWLVSADGSLLKGKPSNNGNWCTASIADEVLDVTMSSCGIALNHLIVTPTALLGSGDCYVD